MPRPLYCPLADDGDSFRLVRLHPGAEGDPIVLTLVPARLSQSLLDYEALSYVWGPAPTTATDDAAIEVDGERVWIRRNLFDFFTVLRNSPNSSSSAGSGSRLLYADAVCINQADDEERSGQVRLMGSIYAKARRVLAWLGPACPETDLLFGLAAAVSANDFTPDDSDETGRIQGSWRRPPEADSDPAVWASLQRALRLVMDHAYWRRAWIVQECLLARELSFVAGSTATAAATTSAVSQVSWDQFSAAHMMLLNKSPVARGYTWGYLHADITRFDHLAGQKAQVHRYPIPLAGIVSRFSAAESTDPRDMVFAFSALTQELQPGHPGRLVADYGLTTTSLYFRAGNAYLLGGDPTARPHRILGGLRIMLKLSSLELLEAVLALIDPDELQSPVSWLVGSWDDEKTQATAASAAAVADRTFRKERKTPGLAYMDCHVADFATLVRLLDERERGGGEDMKMR